MSYGTLKSSFFILTVDIQSLSSKRAYSVLASNRDSKRWARGIFPSLIWIQAFKMNNLKVCLPLIPPSLVSIF